MSLLLLLACGTQQPAASPRAETAARTDTGLCPPGGTPYTWDNFGRQFFLDWCESCHNLDNPAEGVPEGMVFHDEAYVWSLSEAIQGRISAMTTPPMPPDPGSYVEGLDAREVAMRKDLDFDHLIEWLTCGEPTGG